jgi:hypothetical protein
MVVATVLAVVMAWKTKDVNADRTVMDSSSVFYAVSSQLQAWFGTYDTHITCIIAQDH